MSGSDSGVWYGCSLVGIVAFHSVVCEKGCWFLVAFEQSYPLAPSTAN